MALTSFINRFSASGLKGQVLKSISNEIIKSRAAICVTQQQLHSTFNENQKAKLTTQKCNLSIVQKFSTSPFLLKDHKSHDHSKLWTLERALSLSLLPAIPAAIYCPSQGLDTALAALIVLHTHFGLEAIVVDYIRPIIFGKFIPKLSLALLYLLSIATMAGLLNLVYNDAGLANTIITVFKN